MKHITAHVFASASELGDYAATSPYTDQVGFYRKSRFGSYHEEESMDDAVKVSHAGWSTHRATFQAGTARFETASSATSRFEYHYDVSGGWVDVDRYLTGEPECMVQPVLSPDKPILRIMVQLAVSAFVDARTVVESGGIVTGLVDVANASGFAVELYGVVSTGDKHPTAMAQLNTYIMVKDPSQPLDIDNVAFTLAHPDVTRRFEITLLDMRSDYKRWGARGEGGHGYPGKVAAPHPDGETWDLVIQSLADPEKVLRDCIAFWKAKTGE